MLIHQTQANLLSFEDKICQSTASPLVPYTGFKIHRQYVVKNLKPPMLHFVSLSHCTNGRVDYERLSRTGKETDIEWDKPVCLLFPTDEQMKKQVNNTIISKLNNFDLTKVNEIINNPVDSAKYLIKNQKSKLRKKVKQSFNDFIRKISSKARFIEYTDDSLSTKLEDLTSFNYSNLNLSNELTNLKCFKLARRKKYALRKLMVYAPFSWVGGIFECEVPDEVKIEYLKNLKDSNNFLKNFNFKCNNTNSKPLLPLIADDLGSQWIEKEKGVAFSQRVPYLYTPSLLDFRYGKSIDSLSLKNESKLSIENQFKKVGIPLNNWFEEIEINEEYNYTNYDIGILSRTMTTSINFINDLLVSTKNDSILNNYDWNKPELFGLSSIETNKLSIDYLEQKFLNLLPYTYKKNNVNSSFLKVLRNTQNLWDNLKLTKEHFFYNIIK